MPHCESSIGAFIHPSFDIAFSRSSKTTTASFRRYVCIALCRRCSYVSSEVCASQPMWISTSGTPTFVKALSFETQSCQVCWCDLPEGGVGGRGSPFLPLVVSEPALASPLCCCSKLCLSQAAHVPCFGQCRLSFPKTYSLPGGLQNET